MSADPLPERVHSAVSKAVDPVARLGTTDGPDSSMPNFPEPRSRRFRSVGHHLCIRILGVHLERKVCAAAVIVERPDPLRSVDAVQAKSVNICDPISTVVSPMRLPVSWSALWLSDTIG